MEEHKEVFILLKDKNGEKISNMVVGALFGSSDCNILRGELAIRIPDKNSKSGPPHNHQTVYTNHPATFYDDINDSDVAPLFGTQLLLILGVESRGERYRLFVLGKHEWGTSLKVNDAVSVSLKHKQATDNAATPKTTAVIRYVGPIRGEKGIKFGVEITDPHYYGQGTSNGSINGERYFHCKDSNGMFVSLDKLSEVPPGYQAPPRPSPPQTRQPPQSRELRSRNKERKYRFKEGDRVVAFKEDGSPVGGTVRWVGRYSQQNEKKQEFSVPAVGIETDIKIYGTDMESCLPAKHHYFPVGKKKSHLFMREEEVMPEADFLGGQAQKESQNSSPTPPTRPPRPQQQPAAGSHHGSQVTSSQNKPVAPASQQSQPEGPLNVEDQQKFAEQMGADSHTKLVKDQSELMEKIKRESQESDVRKALNISPNQSLVRDQQRILEQIKDQQRSQNNSSRQGCSDHIYDTVSDPNNTGRPPVTPATHPPAIPADQPLANQPSGYRPQQQQQQQQQQQYYSNQSQVPVSQAHHHHSTVAGACGSAGDWSAGQHHTDPNFSGQHLAYAGYPNETPPPPLVVGSRVELIQDHNRHGVIRWTGTLPGIQGNIAGVELDAPMEGCGDGGWGDQRYFNCTPGTAFFCPVTSLRPDPRFTQPGQQSAMSSQAGNQANFTNPLGHLEDSEDQDQNMHPDQIFKYFGDGKGIQGHQNSCYLDATIFGLFALSDVFDSLFLDQKTAPLLSLATVDQSLFVQKEIGSMLWKGIVNPLRKYGAVKHESVMTLRNKLEELGKMEKVNTAEKDPEEFLNMLFKHTLHVDPFIQIIRPSGTEPEFFVQLFVEFDASIKIPTIHNLMTKMFTEQHISFVEVPSKLLVQVPRFGKEFQTYKRIIPEIRFNASRLVYGSNPPSTDDIKFCFLCGDQAQLSCPECGRSSDFKPNEVFFCITCSGRVHKHPTRNSHEPLHQPAPHVAEDGDAVELELLSVLCIETSHYVCFSRDSEGRWIFFDSMADRVYDQYNIPRGVECTELLNQWVYEGDQERLMAAAPRELPELVRRFTQDVYMCVYIQPDYGMYG